MGQSILTSRLPRFVAPMLAQEGTPFDSPEHLFEIKWDGTRVLAFIDQSGYRLVNRNRADVTDRYPELGFLATLPAGIVLDGEIVVLRQGKPDFRLLLSRRFRSALRPVRIAFDPASEHAPGTAGEVDATMRPSEISLLARRGRPRQGFLRGGLPPGAGRSDG